jgi:hypothetical protein
MFRARLMVVPMKRAAGRRDTLETKGKRQHPKRLPQKERRCCMLCENEADHLIATAIRRDRSGEENIANQGVTNGGDRILEQAAHERAKAMDGRDAPQVRLLLKRKAAHHDAIWGKYRARLSSCLLS